VYVVNLYSYEPEHFNHFSVAHTFIYVYNNTEFKVNIQVMVWKIFNRSIDYENLQYMHFNG
jgi:hypothetical protein